MTAPEPPANDAPRRRPPEAIAADLEAGRYAAERWLRDLERRRKWWRRVCKSGHLRSEVDHG